MVPFGNNQHSPYNCRRCGGTVCNCSYTRTLPTSATNAHPQTIFYAAATSNNILLVKVSTCKKKGWFNPKLASACDEPVALAVRVEARVPSPPKIVGGGPMRRRWR
jgi:hypothetical protein